MKNYGIKFKLKDGTTDYYDPLDHENLKELTDAYVIDMTYQYIILKEDVISYEWYDLCQECGHGLEDDYCHRCTSEKELNELKNE